MRGFLFYMLLAGFLIIGGSLIIMAITPALVTGALINEHVNFEQALLPEDFGVEARELTLLTEDGFILAAWEVPVEKPKAVLIFLGGLTYPSVRSFWGHARFLGEEGYASLLVEMRAHGESGGEQVALGYLEHLDVLAGLQYLKGQKRYTDVPVVVYGADLGGAAAINAAGLYPEIAGVVSIAAFSSWADLFADNLYFSGAPLFLAVLEKPFVNLYTLIKFGWENRGVTPHRQIAKIGDRPVFLLHSLHDEIVSHLNLERILYSAPPQVEVWERDSDEHLVCHDFLDPRRDPEYAGRIIEFLNANFAGNDG